jgi:hypothetical protein
MGPLRRLLVVTTSLAIGYGGVKLFGACIDVRPIVVDNDAFDPDSSCLVCLQEPQNCADLIVSCEADAICNPTYTCMLARSCLDLRTIDDKIKCGLACAQEAGVHSLEDPTTAYLVNFVSCGRQKCAGSCNIVDANIGF